MMGGLLTLVLRAKESPDSLALPGNTKIQRTEDADSPIPSEPIHLVLPGRAKESPRWVVVVVYDQEGPPAGAFLSITPPPPLPPPPILVLPGRAKESPAAGPSPKYLNYSNSVTVTFLSKRSFVVTHFRCETLES
eukprot:gene27275-biopygen7988